jgi:hypothetical protein
MASGYFTLSELSRSELRTLSYESEYVSLRAPLRDTFRCGHARLLENLKDSSKLESLTKILLRLPQGFHPKPSPNNLDHVTKLVASKTLAENWAGFVKNTYKDNSSDWCWTAQSFSAVVCAVAAVCPSQSTEAAQAFETMRNTTELALLNEGSASKSTKRVLFACTSNYFSDNTVYDPTLTMTEYVAKCIQGIKSWNDTLKLRIDDEKNTELTNRLLELEKGIKHNNFGITIPYS